MKSDEIDYRLIAVTTFFYKNFDENQKTQAKHLTTCTLAYYGQIGIKFGLAPTPYKIYIKARKGENVTQNIRRVA